MITDLFLGIFFTAAEAIVGFFPADVAAPDLSGIGQAIALGKAFDAGLPISETVSLAQMYVTWLVGLFAIALVIRIWKLIPLT